MRDLCSSFLYFPLLAATLLVGACAGGAASDTEVEETGTPPVVSGAVDVVVVDVGDAVDADGFRVEVAGEASDLVSMDRNTFNDLALGPVDVTLSEVDDGCIVLGDNPVSLTVNPAYDPVAVFEVTCDDNLAIGSWSGGPRGSVSPGDPPVADEFRLFFGDPDVFASVVMTSADVGVDMLVDDTIGSAFDDLVAVLTDGAIDSIPWGYSAVGFGGGSGTLTESLLAQYTTASDFTGATIDAFMVRLDHRTIKSFGPGAGYSYDLGYTMQIRGLPPTMAAEVGAFGGSLDGKRAGTFPEGVMGHVSLGTSITEAGVITADVFEGISFAPERDVQRFPVHVNDNAAASALAEMLTNGTDDCVGLRAELQGAGVVSYQCAPESSLFDGPGPDLSGATITGFTLVIDGFDVKSNKKYGSDRYYLRYGVEVSGFAPAP